VALEVLKRGGGSPPHRPALLFIHGGFHGAWCWDEHFLPWFAERGWDAFALSLRGHARGDDPSAPLPYTLRDYADDVKSVVADLGRPVVLIGHSMGGVVAQQCLKECADVAGSVMVAASPLRPALGVIARIFVRHPIALIKAQAFGDMHAARRAMQSFFFDRDLDAVTRARYVSQLTAEASLKDLFTRSPPSPDRKDKRPMLVIAGRDDWSIPLKDHEALASAYGGELVVCPGGHDLMLSVRWEEAAQAIEGWLSVQFGR